MRTTWRNSLLLLLACSGAAAQVQTGLIRGTLLNDEGSPVANADVFAMFYLHCDLSNNAIRAKIESGHQDECLSRSDGRVDASTDEAGVFELERLQLGMYGLEAQKPQDGYCATFQDTTKVALTPTSPFAEVVFHLPPKCARLRGIVRNAKTGELLTDVSLRLRPTKGPDHCEVVTFDVQIPSQR